MSNNFFIVLPSNSSSYEDNKSNKFRVRLPRKLMFEGSWVCGLHSIVYPNTWASVGTTENQYLELYIHDGGMLRVQLPKTTYLSPQDLETSLQRSIVRELEKLLDEKGYWASRILYYGDAKRPRREAVAIEEEVIKDNDPIDEEEVLVENEPIEAELNKNTKRLSVVNKPPSTHSSESHGIPTLSTKKSSPEV